MTLTNTQLLLTEATDLLTKGAEQRLFKALQDAKSDVAILVAIRGRSLNQNSQLWAARQRVKRITDQIVKANLPLVIRVAKRMNCPGISEEQFVSDGLLKLLQCIDAFKVELGYKFSTYLQRPLYRHFHRMMLKEIKRNSGRIDGEMAFRDRTVDDGSHEVDELMEVLEANTAGLDAIEQTMVLRHFGIGKFSPETLKELSIHFGFSTGKIKKTLANAIHKLTQILTEGVEDEIK